MKKRFILGVATAMTVGYLLIKKELGKNPDTNRQKNILTSKNFDGESFKNIEPTADLFNIQSLKKIFKAYLTMSKEEITPSGEIPFIKTNIKNVTTENYYIWFGHSSYFIKLDGISYLIDPVLSGNSSPIPKTSTAFSGSDFYKVEDLPDIDYLIISHDHYDHLDYDTVKKLKNQVKKVIVPLGVASHFEYWGYEKDKIVELDWDDKINISEDIFIVATTARHSSGRVISQNKTLWSSYVLKSKTKQLFLGGDSSYGKHFEKIGKDYGHFDVAFLENGQYNKLWPENHMFPEETIKANIDLNSKVLIPVHNSKFRLAMHRWNEPLIELLKINEKKYNIDILTPQIGEVIDLDNIKIEKNNWFESK